MIDLTSAASTPTIATTPPRTVTTSPTAPASSAAVTVESSLPSTAPAVPVMEVESSAEEVVNVPSSSTSPASHTQVEIMELRAQEAEAALEAIRAKRMLAEARSTQASTRQHSRAPSVAAPEVEHFDIADPEERETNSSNNANNMHDPVIEHGEVTLPLAATHEASASSRVDQLREFWSSFQRSDSTPRAMIAPALTPPPAHQVDDARDRKIDELRRQLQDLEQRTRPTRTSPDTATPARNIDFAQPHDIHKPKISEWGTFSETLAYPTV